MAKITIKDIARESGYSIGTVSRALNQAPGVSQDAREAVMKVVDKYGYEINPNAKFLKQKNHKGIALLIKGTGNRFFEDVTGTMMDLFAQRGYTASRYYASDTENEVEFAKKIISQRNPEGMIMLGADRQTLLNDFSGINIPVVLAGSSTLNLPWKNLSSVCTNDAAGAQEAVEILFATGHKQIGFIGGDRSRSSVYSDRFHGIQYAFYSRGIAFSEKDRYLTVECTYQDGYDAFVELYQRYPDLDAVFALADTLAIGAMRAAHDLGLNVPEDVSILGFDGLEESRFTIPRLSSVRQDTESIARRSVDRLLDYIDAPEQPGWNIVVEIPYTMQLLESTKDISHAVQD